ncbi:hypothetical protein [Amphritea sp.]|uniref:hypothetical protein n=1 Tax=Amphritea sp. TaxID=1872502 RepID=UPI0025C0415C|nr:hypothetical protein [Amphritea sp.]
MNRFTTAACFATLIITGCTSLDKPKQPIYSGTGGMTKWNIMPYVYLFHYNSGFTGIDALGYDEQLQTTWSRLGAAKTCRVPFDKQTMINRLINQYGEDAITHELNGIGFHSVQSRKVSQFCDKQRVEDITQSINDYLKGNFN